MKSFMNSLCSIETKKKYFFPVALKQFRSVIIFGAGGRGRALKGILQNFDISVECFFDNDPIKDGTCIDGIKVGLPDARLVTDNIPVIISSLYCDIILQQCFDSAINNVYVDFSDNFAETPEEFVHGLEDSEKILKLLEDEASAELYKRLVLARIQNDTSWAPVSGHKIYFHPEVSIENGDTIIDCGARDGDSAFNFISQCDNLSIHSFEPNAYQYGIMCSNIYRYGLQDNVTPVCAGAWNTKGMEPFFDNGAGSKIMELRQDASQSSNPSRARLIQDSGYAIKVEKIDDYAFQKNLKVDCIKMDIEGAELSALQGAAEIIRTQKPKMIIAIYHPPVADLYRIPLYIKGIRPDYKLYISNHSPKLDGIYLYAK